MRLSVKEAEKGLSKCSDEVEALRGTVAELRNEIDGLRRRFKMGHMKYGRTHFHMEGHMKSSNIRIIGSS